jgi:hypothetical protein
MDKISALSGHLRNMQQQLATTKGSAMVAVPLGV